MADEVLRLTKEPCGAARQTLGRAFFDYELMVYAAAEPKRRAAGVTSLYGAILSDSFRHGEVYVTSGVTGVACWLPPGVGVPGLARQIRAGLLVLPLRFGLSGFRRLLLYDGVAQQLHHHFAPMPHWYLASIGVDPEHQGQGIGGALLRPMLARADAQRVPCWLDTHRERNVQLYLRHGFEISRRVDVPGHPVPVWGMLRLPR